MREPLSAILSRADVPSRVVEGDRPAPPTSGVEPVWFPWADGTAEPMALCTTYAEASARAVEWLYKHPLGKVAIVQRVSVMVLKPDTAAVQP